MAERRKVSLLDCAIVASGAVVPVLIGVVALVAVVRPADPDATWRQGRNDRYVSVRHVAALKTFERAIVRRQGSAPATIDAAQVLDGVAACRREWGVHTGGLPWLRRAVLGGAAEAAPAEEIAAHLNELDAALLRFSTRANPRVEHRVGIDAARWFGAAGETLATPVETADAPGRQFRVRCADLSAALATLRRADATMLESLAWRGTEGSATLARWRPDQEMQVTARDLTRRNPWGGAAGCIYLGRGDGDGDEATAAPRYFLAGARSLQQRLCATTALSGVAPPASGAAGAPPPLPLAGEPGRDDPVDDPRWMVPPSLLTLLQPLEPLRQPTGALYRVYTEGDGALDALGRRLDGGATANRAAIEGATLDVGYSIDLTIDPALQALAQKTAACYTGRHDICSALGLRRKEDGDASARRAIARRRDGAHGRGRGDRRRDRPHRGARRRALAVRAPGGRRPGHDSRCDARLPYPSRYRADALLNPAVYHDAMPASTIKPIMATAFLADPRSGARLLAGERAQMQKRRRAGARQPARPADALRLRALPRPHVLQRRRLRRLPSAVGGPGGGARLRLERRLRRGPRGVRQGRPAVRPAARCRAAATRSRRPRPRSPTAAC